MIKITKQPVKGASPAEATHVFLSQSFMDRKYRQIMAIAGSFLLDAR